MTVRVTAPVTVRVHRGRQVIVDVSCDTTNPNNPLPFCNKSTTFENPSYQLTPAEGTYNFNIYLEGHFSRIFKPYTRVALLYVCPALYKMLTCACFLMRCPISRLFFFPFSSFFPLFFLRPADQHRGDRPSADHAAAREQHHVSLTCLILTISPTFLCSISPYSYTRRVMGSSTTCPRLLQADRPATRML